MGVNRLIKYNREIHMKSRAEFIKKKNMKELRSKILTVLMIISIVFFSSIYFILQYTLEVENPIVVVTSGSMEPTIYKGDILIIEHKDPEDIKSGTVENLEGDIILYDSSNIWPNPRDQLIVHRVVGKRYDTATEQWMFETKGDNNPDKDPPGAAEKIEVPETEIRGVVKQIIPKIGWVKIVLDEYNLTLPLTIFLGILLIISFITDNSESEKKKE